MTEHSMQSKPINHELSDETAITARGLRHAYRRRGHQVALSALDDVSFDIDPGQFVCVLGPNGSGKSTLINALCGLIRLHAGSIEILGRSDLPEIRQSIGVVFQRPSLDGNATVLENLRDRGVLYGLTSSTAQSRVHQQLEQAGLSQATRQLVRVLSAGQQRRIDLIRANLHQPRLLLLDEPTVGLDPNARAAYLAQLEVQRRGHERTVFMSTHLTDEAHAADRIIFMNEGRIIADATPDALRCAVGQRLITVRDVNFDGNQWEGPGLFTQNSTGWQMPLDESDASSVTAALIRQGISFTVALPTLDDAFQKLTGRALSDQPVRSEALKDGAAA